MAENWVSVWEREEFNAFKEEVIGKKIIRLTLFRGSQVFVSSCAIYGNWAFRGWNRCWQI